MITKEQGDVAKKYATGDEAILAIEAAAESYEETANAAHAGTTNAERMAWRQAAKLGRELAATLLAIRLIRAKS